MKPIVCHGWQIYFHPMFFEQWQELLHEVTRLKEKLDTEKFVTHPQVKLLKALDLGIREKIPQNPLTAYLVGPLRKFNRLKKMGLPSRYRLFFRVFAEQRTIIILWLGFPRKAGDKRDCYAVFEKLVRRGVFPKTAAELGD